MLISKFVALGEVSCKCGCGSIPTKEMLNKFDEIRFQYGEPIHITSGARCEKHNAKIGGAKNSNHCKGLAIDVVKTPNLEDFILKNLETFDIYIEDPKKTSLWIHIQIVPPKSKKRIFQP
jgi:hypothetical protein